EAALEAGRAYYGENGDEEAQIPVDPHDLDEMKRHVNNAIRMFIADAPDTGWRWARPYAGVVLWPSQAVDPTKTVSGGTYDSTNGQTLLTTNSAFFFDSMEEKAMTITDHGNFTIKQVVSSTTAYVYG